MFRVLAFSAVLATCVSSGARAQQQSVGSLKTTAALQPIPKYAFSAGTLSPNNGIAGVGSKTTFGLTSPTSLSSTVYSSSTQLPSTYSTAARTPTSYGTSSSLGGSSVDPMRWTETRWAVESYLKPATTTATSAYGMPAKATMSPISTSSLLAPSNSVLMAPGAAR